MAGFWMLAGCCKVPEDLRGLAPGMLSAVEPRVLSRRDVSFRTTPAGEPNINALERSLPSQIG
jgi:hypothetical protein